MITLTESAAEQIKAVRGKSQEQRALRVYVQEGGCCGVSYGLAWDEKQDGDQLVEQHGVQLVVDPESAEFLKGSVVDFIETPQGRGFQVRNPNAKKPDGCSSGGCGCGH
jgi:iron-sulfur cluster assembly accessory protein